VSLALHLALALAAALDVPDVAFETLVLEADWIVRGEVVAIHRIPYGAPDAARPDEGGPFLELAAVRVDELHRGPDDVGVLWVRAYGIHPCDSSSAELGEAALWFLRAQRDPARVFFGRSAGPEARDAVLARTGGRPVHEVTWSGTGKLTLTARDGVARVRASDEVRPPRGVDPAAVESARGLLPAWTARLGDVERWIATALGRGGWSRPLHPSRGVPAAESVVLDGRVAVAAWSDGTVVWSAEPLVGGPPYRQARLALASRRRCLEAWVRGEPAFRRTVVSHGVPMPYFDSPRPLAVVATRAWGGIVRVPAAGAPDAPPDTAGEELLQRLLDWIPADGGAPAPFGELALEPARGRRR